MNSVEGEDDRGRGSRGNVGLGAENFRSKGRYVNVKKDRGSLKQNPYLPFQNAQITGDYYIVPVV